MPMHVFLHRIVYRPAHVRVHASIVHCMCDSCMYVHVMEEGTGTCGGSEREKHRKELEDKDDNHWSGPGRLCRKLNAQPVHGADQLNVPPVSQDHGFQAAEIVGDRPLPLSLLLPQRDCRATHSNNSLASGQAAACRGTNVQIKTGHCWVRRLPPGMSENTDNCYSHPPAALRLPRGGLHRGFSCRRRGRWHLLSEARQKWVSNTAQEFSASTFKLT